jgi:GNAT superfamily N-acetyltransferase
VRTGNPRSIEYSGARWATGSPVTGGDLALVDISNLDTIHFGIRSARTADVTTDSLPRILEFCRDEQVGFLIARCNAADLAAARAMCAAGFDLMDTLVYAERSMSEPPPQSSGPTVVRPARPDDVPIIQAIARESFSGYVAGHYHADPRLDRRKCDDVYVSWALRAWSGEAADAMLVGEVDGRIAGFLAVTGGEPATVPIAGVTAGARRRGVYRTLIEASIRWSAATAATRMLISTQITNPVSLNTWLRAGFRTCGAAYTFHKWFDTAVESAATHQRLSGTG